MRLRAWLAAGLLLLAGCAGAAPRAVWTWERDSYEMLQSPREAKAAFAFLQSRQVDTIYLYADTFGRHNLIAEAPGRYRDFIADAHRRGFKVHALLGSAHLNTERYILPAQRPQARAMLRRVLDYNGTAPRESRFDGVNLDIEPHLLAEWGDAHRHELLRNFLDVSAAWMAMKRSSRQELVIGTAMPFWFDGIEVEWRGRKRPASEHLADLYDYVALMDYRDRADGSDGIIAHAAKEIAYAERRGKQVVIGLELTPNELQKVTFHHRSEADLARETTAMQAAYGRSQAFGGFAFHHYRSYRDWVDAQRK